jgi:hypothetical protein
MTVFTQGQLVPTSWLNAIDARAIEFSGVNAAQGTLTNLVSLGSTGSHYRTGIAVVRSSKASDGANTSTAVLLYRADFYQAGVTKIAELIRNAGGADTFGVTAAGATEKFLTVTTSATGSPGTTVWSGYVIPVA